MTHIISLWGEVWADKTNITPLLSLKWMYQARKVSSHIFVR